MNAAEALFLEQGVERTSIEQITTRAGVAKGSFYLQFSSKAEVLDALRDRFVQQLHDRIADAVAETADNDWPSRLAAWAQTCALGYEDAARLHNLVFVAAPPPTGEGMTRNILIDHLATLLEAGNNAHAWSVEDPKFTAIFLFNGLHGIVNQITPDDGSASRTAMRRALIDQFFRTAGLSMTLK